MNILEAYDLTGSLRDAAELAGCSHHTVARYVAAREQDKAVPGGPARRAGVIDAFLPKLEELGRAEQGEDPRGCGAREDHRDGVCGVGAHDAAGGRRAEGLVAGWPQAGAPAVGGRARDAVSVRLR
jgi:hypothetical protein